MTNIHELFMGRAIELAALGLGSVSPNPLVGCVIVYDDSIIGEGWHMKYGEAHAEVNAINSVKDKSKIRDSTVYVTLEPCSHFGKTPPCADLLIKEGVKKVVIGNIDSNPIVSGKGIEKLKQAGIEVLTGVLEKECRQMNRRFFTFIEQQRPYIILKWAETTDGFLARSNFDSKWISNEYSRKLVHRWRAEEDAVLVGSNTARYDDPRLNVRDWSGRNPVRILIDRNCSLKHLPLNLFDRSQLTICYNLKEDYQEENLVYVKIDMQNFLNGVLRDLHARKIQSVIVEGGNQIISAFMNLDLWDEARVFTSTVTFGTGISSPKIAQLPDLTDLIDGDELKIYFNKNV